MPTRKIGLHLRLSQTINDLAARAHDLEIPIFQCFFIHQATNQFVDIPAEQISVFLNQWRAQFNELYLHGSYWINLASASTSNRILMRELELAKKLEFTHIIMHPGSARKIGKKSDGIAAIARKLNAILKNESGIRFVLENTAHAGYSIGGELHDFLMLRERLDHPEKIQFCIDTAHAYSYGYDITNAKGQLHFMELIKKCIGFENVALLHLNDIKQECGSRIDRHEIIGAGKLAGQLADFVTQEPFKKTPMIMELPVMEEEPEKEILKMVRGWDKSN